MDELTDREKNLLCEVMDQTIVTANRKWQSMPEGEARQDMRLLTKELALLGLHILDILEPSNPPTIH